jgi:hypothetical protein
MEISQKEENGIVFLAFKGLIEHLQIGWIVINQKQGFILVLIS